MGVDTTVYLIKGVKLKKEIEDILIFPVEEEEIKIYLFNQYS
jgi:sRNA-binding regulator protein Hfq